MNNPLKINKLKEVLYEYVRVKIELVKLDLTEHLSNILAQMIAYLVIIIMAGFAIIFLSTGIANLINEKMDSSFLGQIIVASFYLLILLITLFYLRSGKLKRFFESILKEAIIDNPANETPDVK